MILKIGSRGKEVKLLQEFWIEIQIQTSKEHNNQHIVHNTNLKQKLHMLPRTFTSATFETIT